VPFLELPLREPQMKNLQAVLHLENSHHKNYRGGGKSVSSSTSVKRDSQSNSPQGICQVREHFATY
jgi:hypothetical protein